jgi:hypothetical protein
MYAHLKIYERFGYVYPVDLIFFSIHISLVESIGGVCQGSSRQEYCHRGRGVGHRCPSGIRGTHVEKH